MMLRDVALWPLADHRDHRCDVCFQGVEMG